MSKVKLAFAANEWKDGDGAEARAHHMQLQALCQEGCWGKTAAPAI